jgi:hypothetical protein
MAAIEARRVAHDEIRRLHPDLADTCDRFIQAIERKDVDAAEPFFEEARALAQRELARGDPLWIPWSDTLLHAGYSLSFSPLEARSESYWEEAYAIQERELGPTNPASAQTLASLVGILNGTGRAREAEPRIREATRVMRTVFGERHAETVYAELMLGANLLAQGRFAEAEPIVLGASALPTTSKDESDFITLGLQMALYDAWGKPEEAGSRRAELALRCALSEMMMPYAFLRCLFRDPAELVEGLDRLQALGDFLDPTRATVTVPVDSTATIDSLAESVQQLDETQPTTPLLGRMFVLWSRVLDGRVLPENRRRLGEIGLECLQAWRERVPAEELADALALQAEFARDAGDHARAIELARAAWEAVRKKLDGVRKERWQAAVAKWRVGHCLLTLGLMDEAEVLLTGAHATLLAQLGPDFEYTRRASAGLHELWPGSLQTEPAEGPARNRRATARPSLRHDPADPARRGAVPARGRPAARGARGVPGARVRGRGAAPAGARAPEAA